MHIFIDLKICISKTFTVWCMYVNLRKFMWDRLKDKKIWCNFPRTKSTIKLGWNILLGYERRFAISSVWSFCFKAEISKMRYSFKILLDYLIYVPFNKYLKAQVKASAMPARKNSPHPHSKKFLTRWFNDCPEKSRIFAMETRIDS